MKVIIADGAGFCGGVQRAIGMAEKALQQYGSGVCREHLVHSSLVQNKLAELGLGMYDGNPANGQRLYIVSAHGASLEEFQTITDQGYEILDTTCQKVKKLQGLVQRRAQEGYQIVILGRADHAEIRGVLGQIDKPATVVQSVEELNQVTVAERVAVFAQTTENRQKYINFTNALLSRVSKLCIADTLCPSVERRIKTATELAQKVDAMIVIGEPESNNTRVLAEAIAGFCYTAMIPGVEGVTGDLLDYLKAHVQVVGVTAGAPTPPKSIAEMERCLQVL